jgi:hypothetical protein
MSPSPTSALTSPSTQSSAAQQVTSRTEHVYRGLTLAAMLLSLATLWLFR